METRTEVLMNIRKVLKYYERMMKIAGDKYGITQIEVKILAFLHHNPQKDTASDIVELRMLPKGNVSQGIDNLLAKNFLVKKVDEQDRRKIHLSLTQDSHNIVKEIFELQKSTEKQLFKGFSKDELNQFIRLVLRIFENAREGLEELLQEEKNEGAK